MWETSGLGCWVEMELGGTVGSSLQRDMGE